MLGWIRKIGSVAFVMGFFALIFAVVPWYVTVAESPDIGGPFPLWVRLAVYLLLGGFGLVLVTLAVGQRPRRAEGTEAQAPPEAAGILMGNTDAVPGREVAEILGLVRGHTIYAIWLGKDLAALVRLLLGGELTEYTEMMGTARELALSRMLRQAADLGADAVLNVRFMTTSVVGSAAELLVYGTAVKLAPPAA